MRKTKKYVKYTLIERKKDFFYLNIDKSHASANFFFTPGTTHVVDVCIMCIDLYSIFKMHLHLNTY